MDKIILFSFHEYPAICRNRLRLLRKFNPHTRIFGIYGGPEESFGIFQKELRPYLESMYCVRGRTPEWKKANTDLVVCSWYNSIGCSISFDIAICVQWDLLFFESVDNLYKDVPANSVGLTSLASVSSIRFRWAWFHSGDAKWTSLLNFARAKFNYKQTAYACEGPGMALPRKFLELYSGMDVPDECHDELRVPLFAQILGFKLYDTGFSKERWTENRNIEVKFFNCEVPRDEFEIELSAIRAELARPGGRRVFHPYQDFMIFDFFSFFEYHANKMSSLIQKCINGLRV